MHWTCDLRVLSEMSLRPHLPCAVKITYRETLLGSCLCWASQWLWEKQEHWRFLLHDFHGFHLTPEVRQYCSGQADNRKRNPMLLFLLKTQTCTIFEFYWTLFLKALKSCGRSSTTGKKTGNRKIPFVFLTIETLPKFSFQLKRLHIGHQFLT